MAKADGVASFPGRAAQEVGLAALYDSSKDAKLLIIQRFIRLFAYGSSTLILALYLSALGISDTKIGLFMTLTLIGDILISFILTLTADWLGRRRVLALGALMVIFSGLVFATVGNFWGLLAGAIIGVISPAGNEIGPFRAIEESTLAQLTPFASRSDVFAWYNLIGTAGGALGMITCGWVTQNLESRPGWDDVRSYRVVFFAYAFFGLVKLCLTLFMSVKCEVVKEDKQATSQDGSHSTNPSETSPLLSNGNNAQKPEAARKTWYPSISKESRIIVTNLCLLFALDSLASGLVPSSWVTYFFNKKFGLPKGKLGTLFFVTSIISAASNLVASSISKRIGLIQTMVFTHLPSAVMLALIPIPSSVYGAMAFLVLRSCTQSMDSAPRSAFLAAVVLPAERTAVMGVINVVKTSSQSAGPVITGALSGAHLFWVAFVIAGSMKACYDLGILAVFKNHKTHGERQEEAQREEATENSESNDQNGNQHSQSNPAP